MKQLIAKLNVSDGFGNKKVLSVFVNKEEGTVDYSLIGNNTRFSISNLQCGWRGPSLPDNIYEYNSNELLLDEIVKAIRGGVYVINNKKLFIK